MTDRKHATRTSRSCPRPVVGRTAPTAPRTPVIAQRAREKGFYSPLRSFFPSRSTVGRMFVVAAAFSLLLQREREREISENFIGGVIRSGKSDCCELKRIRESVRLWCCIDCIGAGLCNINERDFSGSTGKKP